MWELLLSLLGNGDKPGSESVNATQQPQQDAFGNLLKDLMNQRNPQQQLRKQQLMQMVQPTDPFTALLGM